MARNTSGSRPTKPAPKKEATPAPAKRPEASKTVAPAPQLQAPPRKAPGLSAPVSHSPGPKKELSPPSRPSAVKGPAKSLSPVRAHTPPPQPALSDVAPVPKTPASASPSIWQVKAAEREAASKASKASAPGPVSPGPVDAAPKPAPKPVLAPVPVRAASKPKPPTPEEVLARGYPQGFSSKKEFRDATRPMAKLARDGTVFVSGSSVTGVSYGRKNPDGTPAKFGATSDIDVGIASRRLRADSTQVQQDGPGKSFPVKDSALDQTRGRTRERHPIGAKVFNGVPYERTVLVRSHTPVGERTDG